MKRIFPLLLCVSSLWADGFSLYNDSPYPLHAEIRTHAGKVVANIFVPKGHVGGFDYNPGDLGFEGLYEIDKDQSFTDILPFHVIWYCNSGEKYSECLSVSPGAEVSAQECTRAHGCPDTRENKENPR